MIKLISLAEETTETYLPFKNISVVKKHAVVSENTEDETKKEVSYSLELIMNNGQSYLVEDQELVGNFMANYGQYLDAIG